LEREEGDEVIFGESWVLKISKPCQIGGERRGVGPAVYHVALYFWNSGQNVVALNFGGMTTVPPE
jgi:hypothetical protein